MAMLVRGGKFQQASTAAGKSELLQLAKQAEVTISNMISAGQGIITHSDHAQLRQAMSTVLMVAKRAQSQQ